ncbi:ABC transporter ATP-binding protein [Desulfobulbus oligotrophicus]|jgi:branched-chain amino acid transport system ATP-binding protein|uniref:ABC transporter ATP-binding protein n=1 Tax=Desulfobulbus oligotrophicus TaxID=1909699 RepID=A0A7T6AQ82_9BACT|nr:ABC transporter ATP-binding protein [Desulfobulbus oligotrophicus]MDY0391234.1 ABC transporter ATP-binding protein [Desulfobulbus oligotrophicus]QQG65302.1 ABC transporter ATP-binding protein [Desulfobulbus oligotrophicus]
MLLDIRDLHVRYGNVEVLHQISLHVAAGEIVTLLGANGAGKSTTLLSISGLVRPSGGEIIFDGRALHELPAHQIVHAGISQAPEGRRVFGTLTVEENINLGAFITRDKEKIAQTREWIYDLFPRLAERQKQLAGTLSGGEQQMLAIGRALMSNPKLLLLDEPSLGLAPLLVRAIFDTIRTINAAGVTVVLVEQNAKAALHLAHRGYVLEVGRIILHGEAQDLLSNPQVRKAYLGGA